MDFDKLTERRGSHCLKWDQMTARYDVNGDALPMWVADMDFEAPEFVLDAGRRALDHGIVGYGYNAKSYREAISWWMETRHGWNVDPSAVFSTTGLVNAIGLLLDSFTRPGDGIVVFSPVYHAFGRVVRASGRELVEAPLALEGDRYILDLTAAEAALTGREKMLILCSPHNPGGRVWTKAELEAVAGFAQKHDLLLVSDEIHHDLVFPGSTHTPMTAIEGIEDRLVMLTAASKTFNIAGLAIGNTIIPDPALRKRFASRMQALHVEVSVISVAMTTAAYSPEGAAWVDALVAYLDGNRKLFDAGVSAIPGLRSIPLEATYLSWVDFSGTGMAEEEFIERVEKSAGIAANHGRTFGKGGDAFLRFNLGTQRARVEEAVERLTRAFADLQ